MTSNSVSVVIPTYKAAAYIRETLESVFAQTVAPGEVLVVDDASPDETAEIVEGMAAIAPVPVRLFRMRRNSGGPGAPLNRGIAASRGEYIATLDQDDRMRPRRLEIQAACADLDPRIGLVVGRIHPMVPPDVEAPEHIPRIAAMTDEIPSRPLGPRMRRIRSRDAYNSLMTIGCFGLTCSAFFFRRAVWRKCGGFNPKVVCSCDFAFMESVLRTFDVGVVEEIVADLRIHSTSLTNFAENAVKERDYFRILSRFKASLMNPKEKQLLQGLLKHYCHSVAYRSRQDGRYRDAVRYYLAGLRPSVAPFYAAASVIKLLPHYLARRFSKAAPRLLMNSSVRGS